MALELTANFPTIPVVGQLVFKERVLYICAEIVAGLPAWIPLTNEVNTFVHVQALPSSTWNITHNLGTTTPMVQVYQAVDGAMIIPGDVIASSNNAVTISFGVPVDGRAVIMMGTEDGTARPVFSYTHYQNASSSMWTINHMLGYNPVIRVFVGNSEVQPNSITFPNINQAVVTFTQSYIGVARCV